MVSIIVMELPVLGGVVVAGMVLVTTDMMADVPKPVAGIALPSPELVHGVGIGKVEVSGITELETDPLYILPVVPFFIV